MATLNVSVPDDKLDDLMTAIGNVEASTDEERVTAANTWLTEIVRNTMWNNQRAAAANAVTDPLA
tara:strand:- start:515 stop:709 length:195 start_codon:yes stop_codon:yes gene_type:complete